MHELDTVTVFALIGVAFAAGMVDAIAGGGGLLQMPALLAAGLPPHFALATNKAASVFGAATSFRRFYQAGLMKRGWLLPLFGGALVGSWLGARLLLVVSNDRLKPVILVLLTAAALAVFFLKPAVKPENTSPPLSNELAKATLVAFTLGAYDGFFGPGTGTFLILIFVFFFALSLPQASANAKTVNFASNIAAVATFAVNGLVLWKVSLPMAFGQLAGAHFGARLAIRNGAVLIRRVMMAVVFALLIKVGFDVWR
jgi:uncharacterized protein